MSYKEALESHKNYILANERQTLPLVIEVAKDYPSISMGVMVDAFLEGVNRAYITRFTSEVLFHEFVKFAKRHYKDFVEC